jgi:hypothetical protein
MRLLTEKLTPILLCLALSTAAADTPEPDESAEQAKTPQTQITAKQDQDNTRATQGTQTGDAPLETTPLAFDYSNAPTSETADAKIAVDEAIQAQTNHGWSFSTEGFVRNEYRNLWTRLREDHNLRGFVQLGIGTDDMWETRLGVGVDLIPDKVKLGLEAATGRFPGTFRDPD